MTIAIIDSGYSGSRKERIAGGISVKVSAIYKDVLTLKVLFDKTLKEISQMLNLSVKTVETRYLRGKSMLKERFGDVDI